MPRVEAALALTDILVREGVRTVYGVPGGPVLGLCDAIARHPEIDFVLTKHEQAAAYAAFGHALSTGRLGVCMSTLGPGATNLLAGLPVAAVESAPVLAITGQVQLDGMRRGGHQDSSGWSGTPDQAALFSAVCKTTETAAHAALIPDMLRRAIRSAYAYPPGPVHVSLPSGLLHEAIEYRPLAPVAYRLIDHRPVDPEAARRIAARLARAEAPALLLGSRARQDDCGLAAEEFAARFGFALITDVGAKSLVDESHPCYLGCIGVLGHRAAETFLKSQSDLILAVGQTFDEISTLSWDPAFSEGRDLVQLDVVGEEIGKAFPVADASVGHLASLLRRIATSHPDLPATQLQRRHGVLADLLKRCPLFSAPEMESDQVPVLPQRLMADLTAALPADALVLSDSSKWARWLGRFFRARRGQVLSAHDYEPMGWAVAAALGVQRAFPNTAVVVLCGDGAFLMSALEIATAVEQRLPIIFLVANDGRLGIIRDLQEALFAGRVYGTTFDTPDLRALAESLGATGMTVDRPGALKGAIDTALGMGRPAIVDLRFDAEQIPTMRPRSVIVTKQMGLPNPTPGPATTKALFKMLKER